MKKNVVFAFLISAMALSSFSVVEAANLDNELEVTSYPISGRSGVIYDDPDIVPYMTPNTIFSISYSVKGNGYMDSRGAKGDKYLTADDVTNDVVQIDSRPSSKNSSGKMNIGLGFFSDIADDVMVGKKNKVEFNTNKKETRYIYSPDLSKDKYYAVVENKSSNSISGDIIFCNLD